MVDRIPTGGGPGAIAVGDDAVWVAERFAGKVARIDPSRDRIITEIRVGAAPSALAVIGHSVWVANSGDGTLSQIDARTNRVAQHPLRIGNSPAALAAINGRLWVSVQAPAAGVAPPVGGATGGVARVAVKDDPGPPDPAAQRSLADPQRDVRQALQLPRRLRRGGLADHPRGRARDADGFTRRPALHVHDPAGLSLLAALQRAGDRSDRDL